MEQTHVGGRLSKQEKLQWQEAAKHDGFTGLWTWICFLIRSRIKDQKREQQVYSGQKE